MRVVLYAEDMEPITVIELTKFAEEHLRRYGVARLASMVPLSATPPVPTEPFSAPPYVTIRAERFRRNGKEGLMLFTADEVSAMLLKCAFLPGQQGAMREKERAAFASGFTEAVRRLGML